MRKLLLATGAAVLATSSSAAALAATGTSPAPSAAGPLAATASVSIEAGSTTFTSVSGATCQPRVATTLAGRRCLVTFSGRFKTAGGTYRGTYSGRAYITYENPSTTSYASFDSGSVTYAARNSAGTVVARTTLVVDTGTGGITGFPTALSVRYVIEERNDTGAGFLTTQELEGVGVNQLDANLNRVRTFIDRLQQQS